MFVVVVPLVVVPLVVAVVVVGLALIPKKCQQQFFTVQTLLLSPSPPLVSSHVFLLRISVFISFIFLC